MNKTAMGLFNKFKVERTDGKSAEGEKHHGCEYFVLDLDHDPFAYYAIRAYADVCRNNGYYRLADDLYERSRQMVLSGVIEIGGSH